MQPPQQPRPEGVERLAAALPERPKLVTPGRVIMLFLALIGLYVVWPSLVATFGSVNELKRVAPGWFVVMVAAEVASYICIWLLIGLCLETSRYFVIGTAQVVGNAVSKVVPGGSPMGAAMQPPTGANGGVPRGSDDWPGNLNPPVIKPDIPSPLIEPLTSTSRTAVRAGASFARVIAAAAVKGSRSASTAITRGAAPGTPGTWACKITSSPRCRGGAVSWSCWTVAGTRSPSSSRASSIGDAVATVAGPESDRTVTVPSRAPRRRHRTPRGLVRRLTERVPWRTGRAAGGCRARRASR